MVLKCMETVRGADGCADGSQVVALDPRTGEEIARYAVPAAEAVARTVQQAREVQAAWADLPVEARARRLAPLREILVRRRDEVSARIAREVGKPQFEALTGEVVTVLDLLDYYLRDAPRILAPRRVRHRVFKIVRSYYVYTPHGVVAVITPWNYPFLLTMAPVLAGLVAGNAVVNKPSEYTPGVGAMVADLMREAGLPDGLYACLPGFGDTGKALIEAGVDKVTFTGSVGTGRRIAALCGERLIPVTLELGGKDPMVVLADAPVERAARCAAWAGFANCGQICASVERVYVVREVAERFTQVLVEETGRLRSGVDIGPLCNAAQLAIVKRHVEDAVARGARVLAGGRAGEGLYYEPTVLGGVDHSMAVMREETFGPVVAVQAVADEEEAVRLANDTAFGLTASVWSADERRAMRVAGRIAAGAVHVNGHLFPSAAPEVSWGGVKESGIGRTRGPEGLIEMVRLQHLAVTTVRAQRMPFWFPYTPEKYRLFSGALPILYGRGLARLRGVAELFSCRQAGGAAPR